MKKPPIPKTLIDEIETIPAVCFTRPSKSYPDCFVLDLKDARVGDVSPSPFGSAEECKAWLINDLKGGNKYGESHFHSYDLEYRFMPHWKNK